MNFDVRYDEDLKSLRVAYPDSIGGRVKILISGSEIFIERDALAIRVETRDVGPRVSNTKSTSVLVDRNTGVLR
jgi:hypothetical protein